MFSIGIYFLCRMHQNVCIRGSLRENVRLLEAKHFSTAGDKSSRKQKSVRGMHIKYHTCSTAFGSPEAAVTLINHSALSSCSKYWEMLMQPLG